ncbi:MAG: hypothetical protein L0H73_11010, partial [Nitrococcus sp.]|nr:hypothetical protein [Nitrococcus sp.]
VCAWGARWFLDFWGFRPGARYVALTRDAGFDVLPPAAGVAARRTGRTRLAQRFPAQTPDESTC